MRFLDRRLGLIALLPATGRNGRSAPCSSTALDGKGDESLKDRLGRGAYGLFGGLGSLARAAAPWSVPGGWGDRAIDSRREGPAIGRQRDVKSGRPWAEASPGHHQPAMRAITAVHRRLRRCGPKDLALQPAAVRGSRPEGVPMDVSWRPGGACLPPRGPAEPRQARWAGCRDLRPVRATAPKHTKFIDCVARRDRWMTTSGRGGHLGAACPRSIEFDV